MTAVAGQLLSIWQHQYELINLGKHTRYLEIPFASSVTAWYTVKLNIWSSPSIKPWRYVVDFAVNWFQITPLAGGTSHHGNACLWTVAANCCHSLVPPESSLYPEYVKLIALNSSQWRRLVGRSWFVRCRDGLLPAQWWLTSASADTLVWIFFMIANVKLREQWHYSRKQNANIRVLYASPGMVQRLCLLYLFLSDSLFSTCFITRIL